MRDKVAELEKQVQQKDLTVQKLQSLLDLTANELNDQ